MGISCLLTTLAVAILYFEKLPDRIPHHFSFAGEPNAFGGRKMIWSLPVFSVILYMVLTVISFFVNTVAAGERISKVTLGRILGLLVQLKVLFSFIFLYLVIATVRISLGNAAGLGRYSTIIYLSLLAVVLISNIVAIIRLQKDEK